MSKLLCPTCGIEIRVAGEPDFPGGEIATQHYEPIALYAQAPAMYELLKELVEPKRLNNERYWRLWMISQTVEKCLDRIAAIIKAVEGK